MPGGSWACLEASGRIGLSGCPPVAADVDFSVKQKGQISAAELWRRHTLGSPREELAFGVSFWGCWVVKGKFLPLRGLPGIQAPEAHEKVFRGESDGQK